MLYMNDAGSHYLVSARKKDAINLFCSIVVICTGITKIWQFVFYFVCFDIKVFMYYCYRQIVVLVFLLLDCFPERPIDFRVSLPMFYHTALYRIIFTYQLACHWLNKRLSIYLSVYQSFSGKYKFSKAVISIHRIRLYAFYFRLRAHSHTCWGRRNRNG